MAAKKKTKTKPTTRTRTPKQLAKKKKSQRTTSVKAKRVSKKTTAAKRASSPKKRMRTKIRATTRAFPRRGLEARAGGQSGDLQGLSGTEGVDSESVRELLEEGNAFEADVVSGVEDAGDNEKEVRTHEVPEDDVPGEYLDNDK